jgi:hypothetical protein
VGSSALDPLENPAAAPARQEHVFGRLVATRHLTQAQARAALTVPLSRLPAGAACQG